jgi:hypothetical protein
MSDTKPIYLLVDQEVYGPYARADIIQGLATGEVPPDTLACAPGDEAWQPLSCLVQVAVPDQLDEALFGDTILIDSPEEKSE